MEPDLQSVHPEKAKLRVHKLRTIHKQDSEFNMYKWEIVARRLMHDAECHKFLSEGQHGRRNGREALDIVL
eukprot:3134123-Ditylum_brightwellii.AAC.1